LRRARAAATMAPAPAHGRNADCARTAMPDTPVAEITRVIQLAVAPVFLLTAVGTILNVLSSRLARVVDRIRSRELDIQSGRTDVLPHAERELVVLGRRMRLVYLAIGLTVSCAIFVSLLIAIAFVDAFLSTDLSKLIGIMFIAAMLALIAGLAVFLREIFLAVSSARSSLPPEARAR
jgi:hypothetical protein